MLSWNPETLAVTLPIMLKGMVGIFAVIIVIWAKRGGKGIPCAALRTGILHCAQQAQLLPCAPGRNALQSS